MSVIGSPIVLGYIATIEGDAALDRAIEEAQQRDARLIVVHSQRTQAFVDTVDGIEIDETIDPISTRLGHAGVQFEVRRVTESGDPAADLVAVSEEVDADLIVIGLRKRTPVGKLILGSTAQRILLEATCAVLAVKSERYTR